MPHDRLSRDRVVLAAVSLADEAGLEAVSMRSLAARLGVVPMALYKHVSGKEDLVGAMIDSVVAGYPTPPSGLAWPDAVRHRLLAARASLAAHPWLRPAIASATHRTPAVLRHLDAVAGEFAAGGVRYDLVHYAMHALGHRVWGFSPEAFQGGPPGPGPDSAARGASGEDALAAAQDDYPHIVAIARDARAANPSGGCDADEEFGFVLDLLLRAFERLHETGWSAPRHTHG